MQHLSLNFTFIVSLPSLNTYPWPKPKPDSIPLRSYWSCTTLIHTLNHNQTHPHSEAIQPYTNPKPSPHSDTTSKTTTSIQTRYPCVLYLNNTEIMHESSIILLFKTRASYYYNTNPTIHWYVQKYESQDAHSHRKLLVIKSNLKRTTPTASKAEPTTPRDKSKPSGRYPSTSAWVIPSNHWS